MATLKKVPSDEAGPGLDGDNSYPGRAISPSFNTMSPTADHIDPGWLRTILEIDAVVYDEVSDRQIIQTFLGQIMLLQIVLNVGRTPKTGGTTNVMVLIFLGLGGRNNSSSFIAADRVCSVHWCSILSPGDEAAEFTDSENVA